MKYEITYPMAVHLIEVYLEKIYEKRKHQTTSPIKIQDLFNLNTELSDLVSQLRESGHDVDLIVRQIKERLEKKYLYEKIIVNVDGAARGNDDIEKDNVSGISFIVRGDEQEIHREAKYLGNQVYLPKLRGESLSEEAEVAVATNNVTEYLAIIESLEFLISNGLNAKDIEIRSDSRMCVMQINMISKTKATHLIRLRDCAQELLKEFDNIKIVHIPRTENCEADFLVNQMLDEKELENA